MTVMNILSRAELAENIAIDCAAQILATGKTQTVSDLLREVASISMAEIVKVGIDPNFYICSACHSIFVKS